VQNGVERPVQGQEGAVLEPSLRRQDAIPRIAVIPVEGGCELGMEIGDGQRLQAALGCVSAWNFDPLRGVIGVQF